MIRLGRNSLWLLAARLGTQGLAVLFTILLARGLGSADFGRYAFFAAVVFIGNAVTTFGTDMLLIRELAARNDRSHLAAALLLQLLLSVAFIVGTFWLGPFLPNQTAASILALQVYSLSLIPLAFFTLFTTALRGRQRMDGYALLNLLVALLQVLAAWSFAREHGDLATLAELLLAVQVVAALLGGILVSLQIDGFWSGWRFSAAGFRATLRVGAPLGLLSILTILYQKLSLGLLAMLGGAALAGWFSAAQRAVEAAKTGHLAVLTALYPAMAQAQTDPDGKAAWAGTLRRSWKLLLALAVLAALVLSLLAEPLVRLLYGDEYLPAVPVLRLLAWMLVPFTANSFLGLGLIAANRERAVGWALAASLLALLLLSLWWIPAQGVVGAAWAALFAECLQAGLLLAQNALSLFSSLQGESHELPHLS
jgi:O-antigen/teichoic acid export membrane protein